MCWILWYEAVVGPVIPASRQWTCHLPMLREWLAALSEISVKHPANLHCQIPYTSHPLYSSGYSV